MEGVTRDFSNDTGIGLEHVTATREYLAPGCYAVAGEAASCQPESSHPVLVDILAPDFNQMKKVEVMLLAVASSISSRAQMPMSNIFINHRQAHAGMVFDDGKIVQW